MIQEEWDVMMRLETGEEIHAPCDSHKSEKKAIEWIQENEANYPESVFWVENHYCTHLDRLFTFDDEEDLL